MSDRPRVGEILVQAGVIDEMQLSSALGEQSRWGRRLGVTLIKMGMVEEGHLVRALAQQLGLPVASLSGKRISEEVIALVPARAASEHGVIPLFVKRDGPTAQLFLGMEDPSNLQVLDDLSFRTGMEIHPVMVGPSELGEAIDRYYLGPSHASGQTMSSADGNNFGETIGERSLRVVTPEEVPPTLHRPSENTFAASDGNELAPASRDVDIELTDPPSPVLPDGLLDDLGNAVAETERTRIVAKAIAQLLIEKGLLGLDELQAQIARLKGGASS